MNTEQGKEPKFKVGDKARVVAENHRYFSPETEVKIFDIDAYGAYICEGVDVYGTTDMWSVLESDLSPIEEQTNLVAGGRNTDEADVAMLRSSFDNSVETISEECGSCLGNGFLYQNFGGRSTCIACDGSGFIIKTVEQERKYNIDDIKASHYAGWYNGLHNAYSHEYSWESFKEHLLNNELPVQAKNTDI